MPTISRAVDEARVREQAASMCTNAFSAPLPLAAIAARSVLSATPRASAVHLDGRSIVGTGKRARSKAAKQLHARCPSRSQDRQDAQPRCAKNISASSSSSQRAADSAERYLILSYQAEFDKVTYCVSRYSKTCNAIA